MKANIPQLTIKYTKGEPLSEPIKSSDDAVKVLKSVFDMDTIEYQETAVCLYIDNQNKAIGWSKVGIGGLTEVIFDMRVIFSTALAAGATKIILSHNHPSGNKTPSEADKSVTKRAVEAGKYLSIQVLDHIIITKNDYCSLQLEGII